MSPIKIPAGFFCGHFSHTFRNAIFYLKFKEQVGKAAQLLSCLRTNIPYMMLDYGSTSFGPCWTVFMIFRSPHICGIHLHLREMFEFKNRAERNSTPSISGFHTWKDTAKNLFCSRNSRAVLRDRLKCGHFLISVKKTKFILLPEHHPCSHSLPSPFLFLSNKS